MDKKLEIFNDYTFDENNHVYYYKGQKIGMSVTRLIHGYSQPFEAEKTAEMVSKKNERLNYDNAKFDLGNEHLETDISAILKNWQIENKFSTVKGTHIHNFIQALFEGKDYDIDYSTVEVDKERLKKSFEAIKPQAIKFYEDYKDMFELVANEFLCGSDEHDIASSIDTLLRNKYTDELVIVDYKSNKRMDYEAYKNKKMMIPLNKIPDCNYYHYCLQLCIYEYFLKLKKIKIENKFIVYFDETKTDYEIIEIKDLKKEVKKIIEIRRIKNMKSIPVLIIGKSGSGKSTSLRNLKSEEFSMVNVLKKPLPFKNAIKGLESDNYDLIKKFIEETPKKIVVIDDAGYLLTNEFMRRAKETGYTKFTDIALNLFNLIDFVRNLDGDKRVYFIFHEEKNDNGDISPKTVGKLLDNQVCIEGIFTIVLRAMANDGRYIFRTKTTGQDVVKTPLGMFEVDEIENDLSIVDKTICDYYEIKNDKKKDEVKK